MKRIQVIHSCITLNVSYDNFMKCYALALFFDNLIHLQLLGYNVTMEHKLHALQGGMLFFLLIQKLSFCFQSLSVIQILSSVDTGVENSNAENRTDFDNKSGIERKTASSAKSGSPPENSFTNFQQSGEMTNRNTNCFYHEIGPSIILIWILISNINKLHVTL